MTKRTLDGFFKPQASKKPRTQEIVPENPNGTDEGKYQPNFTHHDTYPWPVPELAPDVHDEIHTLVCAQGKSINDQPDLDLLYYQPFIPKSIERDLFTFLRSELFFYRVKYSIQRFGKETQINTPRYTTVFGVDETSRFINGKIVVATDPSKPIGRDKYKCKPRPIPECLDFLRRVAEAATGTSYNFCLVNYYATGNDSISFHSDDERFLGPDPAIASFTLGARRDFLMKHKPAKDGSAVPETKTLKLSLGSGDMILMRGKTQANWLHSIPKRKGAEADKGRINITLRRAMVPGGTENYYRYNVGDGEVYRWSKEKKEMLPWKQRNV